MASKIAAKAGNKYLTGRAEQMAPGDPVYETYTTDQGKERKRKRELPPYLTPKEAKLLKKIRKRARRLDRGMNLCGFRVGWTFWLGLVPGLGDVVNFLLSYMLVINPATRDEKVPAGLKSKMVSNQVVAFFAGLTPVAGDVVMAMWRSNSRNAHLFEKYLTEMAELRERENNPASQEPSDQTASTAASRTLAAAKKWKWNRMSGAVAGDDIAATAPTASQQVNGSAMNNV